MNEALILNDKARHGLQYAERSVGTIYPPFGEQHAPRDKPDAAHRGPDRVRRGGDLCFAPRYRHHPVVGLFFLAANTLLLPIISLVAGTMGEDHLFPPEVKNAARDCTMSSHMLLVLVWTGLVLDIGISTSTVVAGTAREANVDLPNSLVIKAAWLAYLVATNVSFRVTVTGTQFVWSNHYIRLDILILVTLFTKLVFKYGMLFVAKRSLGLGRNPRFIVGYVAQVQPGAHTLAAAAAEAEHPPPLVVRGEDDVHVAETPAGYQMQTNSGERLVTIDRIWRQLDASPLKPSLIEEQKDLCFSFALFKLLRCRFAGYSVSEAGILEAHRFIQRTYIHGARDFARLFRLVKDELAFVHDYHYSSIALPYPHHSLAAASSVLSLCTIGYSVYLVALITAAIDISHRFIELCSCVEAASERHHDIKNIAITRADAAPLFLAIAVLVLCESAELVSYVCSNWTKIGVVCSSYTHRASWRRHHRCIEFLFQHCRLNRLRTTWDQKMQQCTILAPHCPVARSKLSTGLSLIRRFLGMADQSSTRVSRQVKDAIFTAIQRLTTNNQAAPGPGPWVVPQPLSPVDDSSIGTNSTAYKTLSWHVATALLEVRHPEPSEPKAAATGLSRYCAYLVACHPELIPGDDGWCKKIYADAKKDADRAVATMMAASEGSYAQLSQALLDLNVEESNHKLLKDGAALAEMLIASEVTWEDMVRFWSDVLLYLAPSDNTQWCRYTQEK